MGSSLKEGGNNDNGDVMMYYYEWIRCEQWRFFVVVIVVVDLIVK
jgi:hypothetical protein